MLQVAADVSSGLGSRSWAVMHRKHLGHMVTMSERWGLTHLLLGFRDGVFNRAAVILVRFSGDVFSTLHRKVNSIPIREVVPARTLAIGSDGTSHMARKRATQCMSGRRRDDSADRAC